MSSIFGARAAKRWELMASMVAWAFAIIAGCLGLLALMGACWAYHVDEHLLPTKPYYATTNEEARLDAELASFEPRPSGSSL